MKWFTTEEMDLVDELTYANHYRFETVPPTIELEEEIMRKLKESVLFSHYEDVFFCTSFKIANCPGEVRMIIVKVNYHFSNRNRGSGGIELQVAGIKTLSENFGNIYLRPETMADKISELFTRKEWDFPDYPDFSSRYYLQADNEEGCLSFATPERIKLIENQNEISLEVRENLLIAKYHRTLNLEDFAGMTDFMVSI